MQLAGTDVFIPVKHVIMISFPRSEPALKRTIPAVCHTRVAAQPLMCTQSPGVRMCCSTRS